MAYDQEYFQIFLRILTLHRTKSLCRISSRTYIVFIVVVVFVVIDKFTYLYLSILTY